jgi:hypothetical protein
LAIGEVFGGICRYRACHDNQGQKQRATHKRLFQSSPCLPIG